MLTALALPAAAGAATATTVASLLSGESKDSSALAGAVVFAAALVGANAVSGATGTYVYTSKSEFVENLSGGNTITLGLLDLASYGAGFEKLAITVTNGTTTLLSKSFTTLAAAQAYVDDDPVSLGTHTGAVNLTVTAKLTESTAAGAGLDFVIGAQPAPAAGAALVNAALAPSASSGGSVARVARASFEPAVRRARESAREVRRRSF